MNANFPFQNPVSNSSGFASVTPDKSELGTGFCIGDNMYRDHTYYKNYYQAHKEEQLIKSRKYQAEHKEELAIKYKIRYQKHCETRKEYSRNRHQSLRKEAIEHYGNKCACCGETITEFLSIDHINGGGRKHRESVNSELCFWLKKNNYPDGFQVLCYNCNCAKGFFGKCPHEEVNDIKL